MTKKLLNLTKVALLIFSISFLFGSCTKEYYTNDVYIDNPIVINFVPFTVKKADWKWNPEESRYEYFIAFPELTKHMYDNGVINASIFRIDELNNIEVQTPLPYVKHWLDGNKISFTEVISYDISYEDKSIGFYIQSSKMAPDEEAKKDYEFKVSVIFYE